MPRHGFLTWRDILNRLKELSEEHLEDTATVHDTGMDEFYPVPRIAVAGPDNTADGVLDAGHLYLEIDG